MVFLTLAATASFTHVSRRAAFLILIGYAIWCGDLLGEIPFYIGTLLADLSLSLSLKDESLSVNRTPALSFRTIWPFLVLACGLFIASYPPNSAEMAGWSTYMMWEIGYKFFPGKCISPLLFHL